ncbi:MAG: hypothetical protein GVY16_08700 [Planctomycetes bacterium]|nr:CDP-alcohol phosphatidyltransferase family protein [Phycisphaerae bacterium]NBB95806.1 hypothetical protein [Planctomycetota bacterium]
MNWTLANQVTVGRIFMSAAFFGVLGAYQPGGMCEHALLGTAFVLYVLAGLSDILDGYLARSRNEVSAFGRIADPIVDKVLVVGAFAMLAGPDFVLRVPPEQIPGGVPPWLVGQMASAVRPWMVVVILAREFIVSALRGFSETMGKPFPATPLGKLKMFSQSIAIGAILFTGAWLPETAWNWWVLALSVWACVLMTVLSGVVYVYHARHLLADRDDEPPPRAGEDT